MFMMGMYETTVTKISVTPSSKVMLTAAAVNSKRQGSVQSKARICEQIFLEQNTFADIYFRSHNFCFIKKKKKKTLPHICQLTSEEYSSTLDTGL